MSTRAHPRQISFLALMAAGALLQACGPQMSDIAISKPADETSPLSLRASFTAGSHYNGPVERLAWKEPGNARRPVVIVVAGCAFSVHGSEFPEDAIRLSVDENPDLLAEPTLTEACLARDGAMIGTAVRRQIAFAVDKLPMIEIGDPDRLLLYASGEAVPEAARTNGRFTGKLLLGGPCSAGWASDLDDRTPTAIVVPAAGAGAQWASDDLSFADSDLEGSDRVVERQVRRRASPTTAPCDPGPLPVLPANFVVHRSEGRAGFLDRSADLAAEERGIMEGYLAAR